MTRFDMVEDNRGRMVAGHCSSTRMGSKDFMSGGILNDRWCGRGCDHCQDYQCCNDVGDAKPHLRSPLCPAYQTGRADSTA